MVCGCCWWQQGPQLCSGLTSPISKLVPTEHCPSPAAGLGCWARRLVTSSPPALVLNLPPGGVGLDRAEQEGNKLFLPCPPKNNRLVCLPWLGNLPGDVNYSSFHVPAGSRRRNAMHFKGRLSALSLKVLLFSLFSCLRRLRLPWQHQKTAHPCAWAPGSRASCCGTRERPDPCCPVPALGATATLLGCPRAVGGRGPAMGQRAQLYPGSELAPLQQPARLSSSFVPELIYFLSTSDVCYLDF